MVTYRAGQHVGVSASALSSKGWSTVQGNHFAEESVCGWHSAETQQEFFESEKFLKSRLAYVQYITGEQPQIKRDEKGDPCCGCYKNPRNSECGCTLRTYYGQLSFDVGAGKKAVQRKRLANSNRRIAHHFRYRCVSDFVNKRRNMMAFFENWSE